MSWWQWTLERAVLQMPAICWSTAIIRQERNTVIFVSNMVWKIRTISRCGALETRWTDRGRSVTRRWRSTEDLRRRPQRQCPWSIRTSSWYPAEAPTWICLRSRTGRLSHWAILMIMSTISPCISIMATATMTAMISLHSPMIWIRLSAQSLRPVIMSKRKNAAKKSWI